MAEAAAETGKDDTIVSKSLQRWRENRGKRDPKSAGKQRFANGKLSVGKRTF